MVFISLETSEDICPFLKLLKDKNI